LSFLFAAKPAFLWAVHVYLAVMKAAWEMIDALSLPVYVPLY
jgi:hypothetical protein